MKEIWKPIEGYEGLYDVSDQGRVRSYPRMGNKHLGGVKIHSIQIVMGRPSVRLANKSKGRNFLLARLVARQFLNATEKQHLKFKDGNKKNVSAKNIIVIEARRPDPNRKWSRFYGDCCMECKTKDKPHASRGLCSACYERFRLRNAKKNCSKKGCGLKVYARGLCRKHFANLNYHGKLHTAPLMKIKRFCKMRGCKQKHHSNGFCYKHWTRFRKIGVVRDRRRRADSRYKKRRNNKIFKGQLIFNEITNTPTPVNKSLWDGIGHWSRGKEFDACVECNSTLYKYCCRGMCVRCIHREEYQNKKDDPDYKRRKAEQYQRNKERWKAQNRKRLEIYEKAERGEIAVSPKIANILNS